MPCVTNRAHVPEINVYDPRRRAASGAPHRSLRRDARVARASITRSGDLDRPGALLLRAHHVAAYDRFTLVALAWATASFLLASRVDNLVVAAGIYLSSVIRLWLAWYRQRGYGYQE